MNKFVTAFDAIAGSPFPKNAFFDLLTAFHRTHLTPLLLSIPCGCQAVFVSISKELFCFFVPLIDAIAQGLLYYALNVGAIE